MLPQMSGYIICFDKTKHMSFMIKDIKVLGKFIEKPKLNLIMVK